MSELTEKYEDASSQEIMAAVAEATSKKEKSQLMALARQAIRREEQELKEELKQEQEDSKEEKKLLKGTHQKLMDTRRDYLKAYREMNKVINGKSMLKHFDEFADLVEDFQKKANEFEDALGNHLNNLKTIKERG